MRTNPYASNAAASFTAHAVGCGIKPSSLVEHGEIKDQIQRLWLAWTDEADADGLRVPLQLQMLSSEHLPLGKIETLPNGHEIIFGIEFDRIGRRVAYHFHRTHPGDVRQRGAGELLRVPAEGGAEVVT